VQGTRSRPNFGFGTKTGQTQFWRVFSFGGMQKTEFQFRPKLSVDSVLVTKSDGMQ